MILSDLFVHFIENFGQKEQLNFPLVLLSNNSSVNTFVTF